MDLLKELEVDFMVTEEMKKLLKQIADLCYTASEEVFEDEELEETGILNICDELQEKIDKAQESYTGDKADKEAVLETVLLPIAKEAGYDFTAQELKAAEREMAEEKGISEEELENVSGGVSTFCPFIGVSNGADVGAGVFKGISTADTEIVFGIYICAWVGMGIGLGLD